VRSAACRPCAAEPGITGAARTPDGLALPPLAQPLACDDALWAQLDAEGRATVVDCGLFVLFNLYCPNETDETRREYKLTYNAALAARVEALLAAGREVIGAYSSGCGGAGLAALRGSNAVALPVHICRALERSPPPLHWR